MILQLQIIEIHVQTHFFLRFYTKGKATERTEKELREKRQRGKNELCLLPAALLCNWLQKPACPAQAEVRKRQLGFLHEWQESQDSCSILCFSRHNSRKMGKMHGGRSLNQELSCELQKSPVMSELAEPQCLLKLF